ncbi:DUF3759 domain-containing protein [Aspergillus puulaauensis]|uniref:CipC protein n=1 Tax=Aspergillus puulaauensis TaxID=1220207 RepID=A0A7R8AMM8_9EURO|nr:uncharacterized protein APUU_41623S [Aspergillus puulaauensis]BCS25179.1 hypothetical protein APUU_41623S [Aspergillus puulaauensis]
MGFFDDDSHQARAHQEYHNLDHANEEHKSKFSHELVSGAASWEAMRAYEHHCEKNGKPQSHAHAKELLAGFAGAFVDKEVESKGLDFIDKEKAKHHAKQQVEEASRREYY